MKRLTANHVIQSGNKSARSNEEFDADEDEINSKVDVLRLTERMKSYHTKAEKAEILEENLVRLLDEAGANKRKNPAQIQIDKKKREEFFQIMAAK